VKRARVAKKALAKPGLAASVLRDRFREGDRWLVYCEDQDQLSAVTAELRAAGLAPNQYHADMTGDPRAHLSG